MTPEELLKEVGEPVAYYDPDLDCGSAGISFDPLSDGIGLYTSDQVAAAVLKATKPLEERIKWLQDFTNKDGEVIKILEDQLTAAQEEIKRMKRERLLTADAIESMHASHKDQLAKAEQRVAEWQPIETAPKDAFVLLAGPSGYTTIKTVFATGRMCSDYHKGRWIDHANDDLTDWGFEPTHWIPLPTPPKRGMEGV